MATTFDDVSLAAQGWGLRDGEAQRLSLTPRRPPPAARAAPRADVRPPDTSFIHVLQANRQLITGPGFAQMWPAILASVVPNSGHFPHLADPDRSWLRPGSGRSQRDADREAPDRGVVGGASVRGAGDQRRRQRRSASPSPIRLSATPRMSNAKPGSAVIHQACSRNWRPAAIIAPHSGVGGCGPRPR